MPEQQLSSLPNRKKRNLELSQEEKEYNLCNMLKKEYSDREMPFVDWKNIEYWVTYLEISSESITRGVRHSIAGLVNYRIINQNQ